MLKLHKILVDHSTCSEVIKFFTKDGRETPKISKKEVSPTTGGTEDKSKNSKVIPINASSGPKTISFQMPTYQPPQPSATSTLDVSQILTYQS